MRISKRDAKLLLMLLGIVVFLASYLLVYNRYLDKTEEVTAQIAELKPTLDTLENYYANLATYEAAVEAAKTEVNTEMRRYPTEIFTEDQVLYAIDLENRVGLNATALSFTDPALIHAFNGMVNLDGADTPVEMEAYQSTMNVSCELTYDQLKSMLHYIYDTRHYTGVSALSVSYDAETARLVGNVDVSKYYITYAGAEPEAHVTPFVNTGRTQLFG